jgi:hypothetical protein
VVHRKPAGRARRAAPLVLPRISRNSAPATPTIQRAPPARPAEADRLDAKAPDQAPSPADNQDVKAPALPPALAAQAETGAAERFTGAQPSPSTDETSPKVAPRMPCADDSPEDEEGPDLDELARAVLPLVKRMLLIERERHAYR